MSEQAEGLRRALSETYCDNPLVETPREMCQTIVSELGITEEMVEVVNEMARNDLGDCGDHEYAGHGLAAADALSALMEVGNG